MSIYNIKPRCGRNGYSGRNLINFGDGVFSQNTFNPNYNNWDMDTNGGSTFDENGLHISMTGSQYTDLWQSSENFSTDIVVEKFNLLVQYLLERGLDIISNITLNNK